MVDKVPNYSPLQEAIIRAAATANDGVLNLEIATSIAQNPAMNAADGSERKPRSIVAKITRMVTAGDETDDGKPIRYAKQEKKTKDGKPIVKKDALVERIAALAEVNASKLDGMETSPKLALETLAAAIARMADDRDEALAAVQDGTEG